MQRVQDSQYLKTIAKQLEQTKLLRVIDLHSAKISYDQVVIAEHLVENSYHAVKIISIFDGVDQVSQQKLQDAQQEAQFLKNINHPNIAKYQDEFQIGFNYFIVMECVKNLEQFIEVFKSQSSQIPKQILVSFACQILSAINYINEQKQTVRYLSLRNILIDSDNQFKICDFGLYKQVQEELTSSSILAPFTKGAPIYYPSELIQNLNEDIWAFGICLYALAGISLEQCSQLKLKGYQKIEYLGESLNSILSQVLSLDPRQRPSILALIEVFEGIKKEIWTSDEAAYLFNQCLEKMNEQEFYIANQLLSICCQILPNNIEYFFQLGNTQIQLDLNSQAIKSYQKCLQTNSQFKSQFYLNLAVAYQQNGMLDESIKSYQSCLEINPYHDRCYNNLGEAYFLKGMMDEAIKLCMKCLEINPRKTSCYYNLGQIYEKKGMIDEAIKNYQKGLEIDPKFYYFYYNLGNIYKEKGMLDEAIKSYYQCLEMAPHEGEGQCYLNLGMVYCLKNMLDEAIKAYQKCLQINPKIHSCYVNLGKAFQKKACWVTPSTYTRNTSRFILKLVLAISIQVWLIWIKV
ncbi:hypothetical protein ABPG74_019073 [Tetrahymena malaccensis]